eukprot:CAMPEP_0206216810 /NCGR_PEP_ID=MMETSP0047_2-20121206/2924_1 /ASSEMBLY_ACC=CAM_ASM_000192 /TAXON_ID=195065 /ORGANISM="Chroomonas mesostigmatica_cf, Strain CCMP1168" /LENGTH=84 /DNA_ID=CAMNT_0053639191 /DNA_START=165 /DNA_END=419 /DNA_ORIENTATION=+
MKTTIVTSFTYIPRSISVPKLKPAASLRLVVALEYLACDVSESIYVRADAAALFIIAISSIRFAQAHTFPIRWRSDSRVCITSP